jgi:UTP--glucose-1-phosphate uridylyltransferase
VLNGGLGTSMGLLGPKSLLKVKKGLSFLEIILRQAELCQTRLAMMNSFNTHTATHSEVTKLNPSRPPLFFLQHKFPKILQGELTPVSWPPNRELEWNPPGHGDVYAALFASGMLQRLLEEGVRYAFICNSDNLGAGIEESLLGYFAEKRFPFMMEVAEKTPSDIKGGHLARHRNGRLILREAAQCPEAEIAAFQDIRRYRFFNTNNIWVNLEFLRDLILKQRFIDLPMIVNPKTVDPRDEKSPPVYQIETAMGSGISLFEGATAVNVPRARFLPVKTCSDLLAVRSDCFVYSEREGLALNPARASAGRTEAIKIKLDSKYYGKFDLLEERFKQGEPSLVDCDALTIHGDVRFEKGVVIRGAVTLTNRGAAPAVINAGTVIERDLVL